MTILNKMVIIKLFLSYSCVVSILTYLYRHTVTQLSQAWSTLPEHGSSFPTLSGENLFLITFFLIQHIKYIIKFLNKMKIFSMSFLFSICIRITEYGVSSSVSARSPKLSNAGPGP